MASVQWLVASVALLAFFLSSTSGLKCYTCDEKKNSTCPGWTRPALDTVTELGDTKGFYTDCVTIELGDGRIVKQEPMPGETHCTPVFKDALKQTLNSIWNQPVDVQCCRSDYCNGEPKALRSGSGVGQVTAHFLLAACLAPLLSSAAVQVLFNH